MATRRNVEDFSSPTFGGFSRNLQEREWNKISKIKLHWATWIWIVCVYYIRDWSRCWWIRYLYAGEGYRCGSLKKPTDVEVSCEQNSFRHCDVYEDGRITNGIVTQLLSWSKRWSRSLPWCFDNVFMNTQYMYETHSIKLFCVLQTNRRCWTRTVHVGMWLCHTAHTVWN